MELLITNFVFWGAFLFYCNILSCLEKIIPEQIMLKYAFVADVYWDISNKHIEHNIIC